MKLLFHSEIYIILYRSFCLCLSWNFAEEGPGAGEPLLQPSLLFPCLHPPLALGRAPAGPRVWELHTGHDSSSLLEKSPQCCLLACSRLRSVGSAMGLCPRPPSLRLCGGLVAWLRTRRGRAGQALGSPARNLQPAGRAPRFPRAAARPGPFLHLGGMGGERLAFKGGVAAAAEPASVSEVQGYLLPFPARGSFPAQHRLPPAPPACQF